MTKVKGTAVSASVRFINDSFGPDALRQVLGDLPAEDRALLESGVLVSSWYPFSLLLRLTRAAQQRFGQRVPNVAREMGRASADYGLTTVYKIFFKVGSPHFIISRASTLFASLYDSGEMKTVVSEKGHAVMEVTGFGEPAAEFCERAMGWMQRTIELAGGKNFRIVHPSCAARGEALCRFEGWWD